MNRLIHAGAAASLLLALGACGGGDTSDVGITSSALATRSTKASVSREPAGTNCAYGGSRIDAGIDRNGNGVLDAAEIGSTQYACNGAAGAAGASGAAGSTGAAGAAGATGATGANAAISLVRVVNEAPGAHCAQGGSKVDLGVDANRNGVLDDSEVSSSAYVCEAATGATGAAGAAGTSGANGHVSLLSIAAEPFGVNCTYGGTRVQSGVDANDNGVLDTGEFSTAYNCNAQPGAGVTWIDVQGTSAAMAPGLGYLADNPAAVTLTLPAAPSIGDAISVTGLGTGGWTIAQNPGQFITTGSVPHDALRDWTPRATAQAWTALASSADGSKLVAAASGGQVYTSSDAGETWVAQPGGVFPGVRSLASSSDGTKLFAAVNGGLIYRSTDAGTTWTAQAVAVRSWQSIACSADGTMLLATYSDAAARPYRSTNSGTTWRASTSGAPAQPWSGTAMSADGKRLVAAAPGGQIYTLNLLTGTNWVARDSARAWQAVASSSDGIKLVAVVGGGQVYTSADAGETWTARDSARNWIAVASSADGSKLVAAEQNGRLYTSTDSGLTWTPRDSARNWQAVASSADGNLLSGAASGDMLWLSNTQHTRVGSGGWLSGGQFDAADLQYVGNGNFILTGYNSFTGGFGVR